MLDLDLLRGPADLHYQHIQLTTLLGLLAVFGTVLHGAARAARIQDARRAASGQ